MARAQQQFGSGGASAGNPGNGEDVPMAGTGTGFPILFTGPKVRRPDQDNSSLAGRRNFDRGGPA
jgi:hypothetical protein